MLRKGQFGLNQMKLKQTGLGGVKGFDFASMANR